MGAVKPLARAFDSFLILLATFLLHRFLTYPLLYGAVEPGSMEAAKAFFVGSLSDFWVAYLWAVLIGISYAAVERAGFPNGARGSSLVLLSLAGIAAAAHVSYIEFFHFQVIPFHLHYLFDPEFVAANGSSLLTARTGITLAGFMACALLVLKRDLFGVRKASHLAFAMGALSVVALLAHNRNLHLRVQWFIPENLQVNGFEKLYLHLKHSRLPKPLSRDELKELAALVGEDPNAVAAVDPPTLFHVLTEPVPHPAGYEPFAETLRSSVLELTEANEKPLVLVLLMESLRPAETGYFSQAPQSLTPNLDALAENGVAFFRAYSTGTVTRGAQEATFCGYRGARDSSLMRGLVIAKLACLPEALQSRSRRVWLHGGEGRFDGQVEFWKNHGIDQTMTIADFPVTAARTGWGIGDRTFLDEAAERLDAARQDGDGGLVLGMVLTVTNHIPWALPADATPSLDEREYAHPSHKTTAYADQAIGSFVHELKRRKLWDKTLLVLVTDHGNGLPPATDLYEQDSRANDLLASHANLILSGGLVEQAAEVHRREEVVSQADVAPFLAYVTGADGSRYFADGLFTKERRLPVYADLEQGVFVPESLRSEALVPLYRRALFQYMSTWHE